MTLKTGIRPETAWKQPPQFQRVKFHFDCSWHPWPNDPFLFEMFLSPLRRLRWLWCVLLRDSKFSRIFCCPQKDLWSRILFQNAWVILFPNYSHFRRWRLAGLEAGKTVKGHSWLYGYLLPLCSCSSLGRREHATFVPDMEELLRASRASWTRVVAVFSHNY